MKKWILIDCTDLSLGRLSSYIATRLMGKHNPRFVPHIDCGDGVVAINTDKIKSKNKKIFYKHTGYPGSIKSISLLESLKCKSDDTLINSVRRMLSRDRLIKNLRAYKTEEHKHTAQQLEVVDFKSMNRKNTVRSNAI